MPANTIALKNGRIAKGRLVKPIAPHASNTAGTTVVSEAAAEAWLSSYRKDVKLLDEHGGGPESVALPSGVDIEMSQKDLSDPYVASFSTRLFHRR